MITIAIEEGPQYHIGKVTSQVTNKRRSKRSARHAKDERGQGLFAQRPAR